jgi:hypothetical protein
MAILGAGLFANEASWVLVFLWYAATAPSMKLIWDLLEYMGSFELAPDKDCVISSLGTKFIGQNLHLSANLESTRSLEITNLIDRGIAHNQTKVSIPDCGKKAEIVKAYIEHQTTRTWWSRISEEGSGRFKGSHMQARAGD